ncbi:MAG: restriction endonuclease subunit S [Candidatus Nitrosotenuis sp.]
MKEIQSLKIKEKLKEITEQIFSGGTPDTRREEYWNGNIPWLSSGETRQTFIRDTEKKITQSGVENSSTRLAKVEDVVVAGAGQGYTRGQTSFCLIDTYVNQSVVVLRAKKGRISPFFLFYNLLSRYDELRQISDAHSSRGSLTTKLFAELTIKLPPLKEQKIISQILSNLDFKIELNQQMNKTLEAMGQAIFKHWFVDFEFPDEKGRPYKSSGGEMVYSEELGKEIPRGWEVKIIADFCKVRRGSSPRPVGDPKYFGGSIPWIKIADATRENSTFLWSTRETVTEDGKKKSVFQPAGSLIVSNSATIGLPIFLGIGGCIHDGWLYFENLNKISREYLYFYIKNIQKHLNTIGDGSVQKNLNTDLMGMQQIIVPTEEKMKIFTEASSSIFNIIKNNDMETITLKQIRDSLLPKLMSGKIRVPVGVT